MRRRRALQYLAGSGALVVGTAAALHEGQKDGRRRAGSTEQTQKGTKGSSRTSPSERSQDESLAQPPPVGQWTLAFEDAFEGQSLDEDRWGVGWGWGWATATSPTRIARENVSVSDGKLRLRGTHDSAEIYSGAVNTKNLLDFGPGDFLQARIKFANRTGFQSAFWAKPVSERWPPEIDIVELFQSEDYPNGDRRAYHHLHYSKTTNPGDSSTHESVQASTEPGDDLTTSFHTYGFDWRDDRLAHYVDGEVVREWTDPTILRSMERGAPFYVLLSLNVGGVGNPDVSEQWGEEMVVDWVRLWQRGSDDTER